MLLSHRKGRAAKGPPDVEQDTSGKAAAAHREANGRENVQAELPRRGVVVPQQLRHALGDLRQPRHTNKQHASTQARKQPTRGCEKQKGGGAHY